MGLKWEDGWWFVQVLGTSQLELKPWTLLNENTNRAAIGATTAGSDDEVRDENSRLLLEPDDDERGIIHQIYIGVDPSRMNILPEFGREQNLGLEQTLQAGEDEIWITGFDSPYNNPSQQSEIIYVNDMSTLKLIGYNPEDEAREAKLSFFINKIFYATVTDTNMMKAMLQNQITSSKHMMGLGETRRDQLTMPEWLEDAFGEHILTTQEILQQGDTSGVTGTMEFRDNVDLENASSPRRNVSGGGG